MKFYIDRDDVLSEDTESPDNLPSVFNINGITLVSGYNFTGKTTYIERILSSPGFVYAGKYDSWLPLLGASEIMEQLKEAHPDIIHYVKGVFGRPSYFPCNIGIYCCTNRPESILYMQYPENGYHPVLQRIIMKQIVLMSDKQHFIIESNNECIFNQLRIHIKEGLISKDKVSIYWFNYGMEPQRLFIDKNGNIDYWPKGCFDSSFEDLCRLIQRS